MVTWFAGLFYLPRLFVYHAMSDDLPSIERFKIMERKLYYGIMTPGAVLTIIFGMWLWLGYGISGSWWLHAKLFLVAVLVVYHYYCGRLLADFKLDLVAFLKDGAADVVRVNEDVAAAILLDESVTLFRTEPLDLTFWHLLSPAFPLRLTRTISLL